MEGQNSGPGTACGQNLSSACSASRSFERTWVDRKIRMQAAACAALRARPLSCRQSIMGRVTAARGYPQYLQG